jgi:hypothetical protein
LSFNDFDNVLMAAAEMGLNLQSDEFWELRPDNFMTMYLGFRTSQQNGTFAIRRLMSIVMAAAGSPMTEEKILPLPLIDSTPKKEIKTLQPTPEQIAKIEKDFRERQERKKLKK